MPKEPQLEKERPILTVRELAGYLRVNVSTIHRLIRKKELPGFRVGRDWRFKLEAIESWIRDRQKQSKPEQAG
jgi:excisionase family DNA binding protein